MAEESEKPVDSAAPSPAEPSSKEAKAPVTAAKAADDSPAGEASPARSDGAPAEPRKKKKRKKKTQAREEEPAGPVLGPEGWERPAFVLGFPKDPELERVVRAFELGNYAYVREHAEKLAESTTDPAVRDAAEELLSRIEPDPLVKILFGMSVAMLAFMVFYAYTHGH